MSPDFCKPDELIEQAMKNKNQKEVQIILEAFRKSLKEAQSEEEYKNSVQNVLELTKNFQEMTKLIEKIGSKQNTKESKP